MLTDLITWNAATEPRRFGGLHPAIIDHIRREEEARRRAEEERVLRVPPPPQSVTDNHDRYDEDWDR
ncbi:MAG: hypothetical protein AB7O56_13205 [Bauldia sp.]